MTTASLLSKWFDDATKAVASLQNRYIYTAQGKVIGYSTVGHDGDLCNAIAHIEPQYYSIPPEQWYIKTLFGLEPVTKHCLDRNIRPKWSIVNVGTGQISVPATVPGAPPVVYTTDTTGKYISVAEQQEKQQAKTTITTPLLVIGGGAAILGLALLVSR